MFLKRQDEPNLTKKIALALVIWETPIITDGEQRKQCLGLEVPVG